MTEIPSRAEIVVIGGGVIGASVAYHLTQLGWTDVLLLEQGRLSGGTTWHAAGLVGPAAGDARPAPGSCSTPPTSTPRSRPRPGSPPATGTCGGVIVARTEDRMAQLRRTAANAVAYDLECELLTPGAGAGALPARCRVDDLRRRHLAARGRQGQPDRPDPGARRGARQRGARIVERRG